MKPDYDLIMQRWPFFFDKQGNIKGNFYTLDLFDESSQTDKKLLSGPFDSNRAASYYDSVCLVHPRKAQRTIAPGRDFYVSGYLYPTCEINENAVLTVEIRQFGQVLRHVSCSHKDDKANLYVEDNPDLYHFRYSFEEAIPDSTLRKLALQSCCPDLVCSQDETPDGRSVSRREAFTYTWNKAYYTDTFFSALIYGGLYGKEIYDPSIRTRDINGDEITPLEEGDYILSVELTNPDGRIAACAYYSIKIGFLPDKILSPFSFDYRLEHNHTHNLEMVEMLRRPSPVLLWDPFPGFWTSALIYGDKGLRKNSEKQSFAFAINAKRAVFNDSLEYRGGRIHLYNYGISATSASLCVEYAEILKQKQMGKDIEVKKYCYEYGEPDLVPGRSHEIVSNDAFSNVRFKEMEGLVSFLRVRRTPNRINDHLVKPDYYDTLVDESIHDLYTLESNGKLSIVGICDIPDQAKRVELMYRNETLYYLEMSRVQSIHYLITDENDEVITDELKEVALVRPFQSGAKTENRTGVFEFEHVFDFEQLRKRYHFSGNIVRIMADYCMVDSDDLVDEKGDHIPLPTPKKDPKKIALDTRKLTITVLLRES